MGGKAPENKVKETQLSKEQFKILDEREQLYNSYIQPELKSYYQDTKALELNDDFQNLDHMPGIAEINSNFTYESQTSDLQKILKQRGIDDKGATDLLKTQGQLAGSNAYNNALLQSILQHNNLVNQENKNTLTEMGVKQGAGQMLTSTAPSTTGAVPIFFNQKPAEQGFISQLAGAGLGAASSYNSMGGMMGGNQGASFSSTDLNYASSDTSSLMSQRNQSFFSQG